VLITLLAGRLESPIHGGETYALQTIVDAQLAVNHLTSDVVRGFEALVGAMSTDTLASPSMLASVGELLDALSAHQELEGARLRLIASGVGIQRRPTQLLRVITEHNEEGISVVEQAAWRLKELVDVARQEQVLAHGRDLLEAQQDLLRELQEMKASGAQELSPEARRKLDELDATLRRLEDELARLVERSPYANQNVTHDPSDDEQDVRGLRERLAEIRELMAQGRHDEAMKLLEDLQRETQEMMAALQGDFDLQASREETSQALSDFDLRLGELTNEQAGLTGETEEEERRLDAEERTAMEAQLQEAMKEAKALAERLEAAVEGVAQDPLHRMDQSALGMLRKRARETRQTVERLEHTLGAEQARDVEGRSRGLAGEVGESEAREGESERRDALRGAIGQLEAAERLADELADELEQVRPRSPRPSGERRERSSRLERRQRQIERAMSGLEEQLEGVEQTLPGIGEALEPAMKEARESMRGAAEELGGVRPGEAAGRQRTALERLGAMKRAIDKRIQDASGRRQGGPGVQRHDQRVEIPDADDHRSPRAFREELLKAMKERAPERFEEAIERYYEGLIR